MDPSQGSEAGSIPVSRSVDINHPKLRRSMNQEITLRDITSKVEDNTLVHFLKYLPAAAQISGDGTPEHAKATERWVVQSLIQLNILANDAILNLYSESSGQATRACEILRARTSVQ